jgi:uncharacterized protein (DUF488 family)
LISSIGFSKKNLREFIDRLQDAGVEKVIDIRLNNTSQLAGYSKKQDLEFVLELVGIGYEHRPEFAPTEALMKDYKGKKISWAEFENIFNKLLEERNPLAKMNLKNEPKVICLLCSEDKPTNCHRGLVAEFMKTHDQEVVVKHL